MKRSLALFCTLCLIIITLLACNHDTGLPAEASPDTTPAETLPPVTSDTNETTPAETLPSGVGMTLEEILRADPYYDIDVALAEVTKWIQSMFSHNQEDSSQYSGWVDYEIADIVPTHSPKTGFITGFVFEIFNENGERSYVFYDFPTDSIVEHPQAASPFLLFGEEIENDQWLRAIVGEVKPENVFYFAHPREGFEYGILQEDGSVILYAANYYLNSLYYKGKDLHWRQITIDDLWPDSDTPAETAEAAIKLTFPEILADEIYDQEKLYEEGAACAEMFYPDCEIVGFTFLRSIRTGYSAYVALDLVDDSGQYVYFVYDGEKNDIAVFFEGGTTPHSPYGRFEEDPDEYPALSERIRTADPDEVYDFYYPPLSFACGILNGDGTVDVYRLHGYDGTYFTITTFEVP